MRKISRFERDMGIERNSNHVTVDMVTTCKKGKTAVNRLYKAVEDTARLSENERKVFALWLEDSEDFIASLDGKTIAKELDPNGIYDGGWVMELEYEPECDSWYIRVTLPLTSFEKEDPIEIPSSGEIYGYTFTSEKRSKTRTVITFDDLNAKGEKVVCEIGIIVNDCDNSIVNTWYEYGRIEHPYHSYINMDTYITKDGDCRGRYNPTIGENGKLDFNWVLNATQSNLDKLMKEFVTRAYYNTAQQKCNVIVKR